MGGLECDLQSLFNSQLYLVLLNVEHLVEGPLVDHLKHYDDVWDRGDDSHQQRDVWMSQDTLHYDFILDFRK